MKDLLLRACVVVRTSNMKISRRRLADYSTLRQNIATKSVPHGQHDYFSSFNQSNHLFVALSLRLLSSNLKLPTDVSSGSPSTERMLLEIPALTFIYNENVILTNFFDTNFFHFPPTQYRSFFRK